MGYDDEKRSLRTDLQTKLAQIKEFRATLDTKGRDKATPEDQNKYATLLADGKAMRARLDELDWIDAQDTFLNEPADGKAQGRIQDRQGDAPRPGGQAKTWGRAVIESETYKQASRGSTVQAPRMDGVNVKAIIGSSATSGGALVPPMRVPDVVDIPQRPITILDLINSSTTQSDVVEYPLLSARTNNAAPVAEWLSGMFGLKPESDMTWELKSTNVKTIATWVPASRRILQDAPDLENTINTNLTQMLRIVLENQVIRGDGTGENFLGMINTPGILSRTQGLGAWTSASDTIADTIYRAMVDIELQFYTPTGVALNPRDAADIVLAKDTTGQYVRVIDEATNRIWSAALTKTAALNQKEGLVSDFQMAATIWDRMQTEIRVGEPNDFFVRNAVAVLAELRAAFAVLRPKAINKLTFTP